MAASVPACDCSDHLVGSPDSSGAVSSSYLNSIGEGLAVEGGYHISIDVPASSGLAPLSSPDDSVSSLETGCQSDGSSGSTDFCIVTPAPEGDQSAGKE